MPAPDPILSLVERFEFHRQAYILGKYNETQLRREFVDKFFSSLGWDVDNNKGFSEKYKEVLHEEPVRIRGTTLFFDYTFRIGGARKFIVETKKPSVRIKDDTQAALQLRRYAWNQKLPLSILTNFEEFAIYDCRIKPENSDAASKARIEYFTFKEYAEKWDWLVSIIAPDSILRGSFDKYAETTKGKRGTATVDDDILAEIEQWRDTLAKNIALRNPSLTVEELNSVVQRTIDRILFLRICEDRGIEEYETLHKLLEGEQIYERICQLFRYADDKYNSGLFHFQQEPDWDESPDTLSLTIVIDDKVLKEIIKRLYFPDSQYEFSLIPPAILGHVYEQFLGKVIRLTEGHQAKVEYKPEVKKAGGVFYTPQYIVEYIVKHTVGELVKDKTPREVSKLRILDPACGSGSFLIGAYQYLLDWHRDWYIAHLVPVFKEKNSVTDPAVLALLPEQAPRKKKSAVSIDLPIYNPGNGKDVRLSERVRSDWKLTTAEKKRILLNNIFGVDIDQQAVEVTKLSLLLKVLEEENQETVSKQLTITAERALPSLDHNIKCGNSLIGWDILTPDMPADEVKRINPFDWSKEFEPVMTEGGFDAVIGNPPYGYMISDIEKEYFETHYPNQDYQKDLYLLFIERYHYLITKDGLLGIIVSNTWLQSVTYQKIRKYLTNNYRWLRLLHLPEKVFKAVVDTHVLIFEKCLNGIQEKDEIIIDIKKGNNYEIFNILSGKFISKNGDSINIVESPNSLILFKKILSKSKKLQDFCAVFNGAKPFEKGKGTPPQTEKIMREKPFVKEGPAPNRTWSPLIRGRLINRYKNLWNNDYWIQYGPWLAAPRDPKIFEAPFKIVVRQTGDSIIATLIQSGFIARDNLHILLLKDGDYKLEFIVGMMNSQLMDFIYTTMNPEKGEALAQVKKFHVEQLPIRTINFADPVDIAHHDRMVALVTQMLDLNKKLQDTRLEQERTMLSRQIEATDGAIDTLVYELYRLTEEEIRIVERK